MAFYLFLWSQETRQHVAEHGITREEFEEVVQFPLRREPSRSHSDRCVALGFTSAGRYLACVYELLNDGLTVLPITAYEPD